MSFSLPRSQTASIQSADLKQNLEDFLVNEVLSFEPSGDGEHCFLLIEKRNANTNWIAKKLAKRFGVKERDVGYAGLKDRHGITRQWFSVHIPGQDNPQQIEGDDEFSVLRIERNNKKLKQGSVKANQFEINLRRLSGDKSAIEKHLEFIKRNGFPNYFGAQRFGHQGRNVEKAIAMLSGTLRVKKHQRSIYLSALRSWFFNRYLAHRIEQGTWLTPLTGDRMMLAGSRSFFHVSGDEDNLQTRVADGDIHIAGPLPGEGIEEQLDDYWELCETIWQDYSECIKSIPVKIDWRSLRVIPLELAWQFVGDDGLKLTFSLSSGSYATGLLEELGNIVDCSVRHSTEGDNQ